jgi:L-erythro-3,5-diaminohexanoate dehydrogenase
MSVRGTEPATRTVSDPTGLHRVLDDSVVLPQAAQRLDVRRELWPDEVRIRVETLNLDAASFRQLEAKHGGNGAAVRREVLQIVAERGKMQNPVTGSGGMLVGTVEEVGAESALGLSVGDHVATLVSLSLTPLVIEDGLERWDGTTEQVPADGYAILFGRSIAARIPDDLPAALSLAVMDVCGAPALTHRVVAGYQQPVVAVIGGAGKSGSLSLAAAARAGSRRTIGVVPPSRRPLCCARQGWPTRSSSRTRVTRSPCATQSRPPADRPTSPWSASTYRAARAGRSWPPPSAAR